MGLYGPLTATEVAEHVGESPANCSWHLRQLAKYGFVAEAGGGTGRRRPWRLVTDGHRWGNGEETPELARAGDAAAQILLDLEYQALWDWMNVRRQETPAWRDAAFFNQFIGWYTAEELGELQEELRAILARHLDRLDDPAARRLWLVCAVAAAYGLSYIALGATVTALVQELVPAALLPDANGALQTVKQGLRLAGPLLGAGLYVVLGGPRLSAACALGFVAAAGAGLLLRVAPAPTDGLPGPAPTAAPGVDAPEPAGRGGLGAGVRHLVGEPALRRVLVAATVATVAIGFGETLWFAYVDAGLGRPTAFLGVLVSVQGVGGLLGGVASAALVRRLGELGTVGVGVTAIAAGTLALVRPALALALLASVLIGLGLPVALVGTMTLVQRRTPAHLVGRVSAALDALISGPQAVAIGAGALLVGLVDYRVLYGVTAAVLAGAAGYLVTGRHLTAPEPDPAAHPDASADPLGPQPAAPEPAAPEPVAPEPVAAGEPAAAGPAAPLVTGATAP
ncbi:MFS transporter [Micromonospora sp. NPDC047548]|uniref:MFS transporter n=1 Tax=Micromonospora sp. NPDC047548 TaxID=3155624 RepID=UPI00340E2A12